jgi:hypothetical protein
MVTDPPSDREKKAVKAMALAALAAKTGKVHGTCLSDEDMAVLVDGRRGGAELPEFWAHLASCDRCYEEWTLLRKRAQQNAPRGRLYHLSRLRKFRYIGTALAAAASIAVYLNVIKTEDKVVEHNVVPQNMVVQDKNLAMPPLVSSPVIKEKNESAKVAEQAPAAVGSGTANKGQLEVRLVAPQRSVEKPQEERPKRTASPATVPAEKKAAKDLARDAAPSLAESEVVPAAAPPVETIDDWLKQLRTACESNQQEARFWVELVARGVKLQSLQTGLPVGNEEEKMVAVLALVQMISGPDTVGKQCRLILAELAKEGGSR